MLLNSIFILFAGYELAGAGKDEMRVYIVEVILMQRFVFNLLNILPFETIV